MADKQSNKERLKEITDNIEQGIKELFQSDKYRQYLSVISRFHRYSVNNTMLIYLQKPDASLVAGYNKWQKQFERHVKKGEHGITIIAPTPFKKKIEEQKLDPDTKAPMLDQDGNIITEEKEIEIPMFRPIKVFDVSQTDGKPLPQLAASLNGNVQNYEIFMEALKRSAPVPLAFEEMSKNTDGYFSPTDQRIAIRSGMSEVQTVSAAVHEITHSKLHNKEIPTEKAQWQIMMVSEGGTRQPYMGGFDAKEDAEVICEDMHWEYADESRFVWSLEVTEDAPVKEFVKKDRHTEEVEAESVSYTVCQYYGIQTGENSFGYIAAWSQGKELPELRASLETINKTAGELISDIDRHYREICKERDIDPRIQESSAAVTEPSADGRQRPVLPDIMTGNGQAVQKEEAEKLIGRIDFLGTNGAVSDSIEYSDARKFEKDLRSNTDSGVPMSVVLYKDNAGQVVPHDFIFELDPPPKGLTSIESPTSSKYIETCDEARQRLDEYPMPDNTVSAEVLKKCGYPDDDLLPLSRERAGELIKRDLTVYLIQDGGKPEMAFDTDDLDRHNGVYAISREEWEQASDFHKLVVDRMDHQQEREQAFLHFPADCYAIYQVRHDDPQNIRFMNMDWLKQHEIPVSHDNYDLVYTGHLTMEGSTQAKLDKLFEQFNFHRPADYHSPSMSVSDIVVLRQNGVVSCHYADSIGFTEVPGFLPDNALKNAEIAVEDDYGMIDGIINNGSKAPTTKEPVRASQSVPEANGKKPSVLEKLHVKTDTHKKKAPVRSAERER